MLLAQGIIHESVSVCGVKGSVLVAVIDHRADFSKRVFVPSEVSLTMMFLSAMGIDCFSYSHACSGLQCRSSDSACGAGGHAEEDAGDVRAEEGVSAEWTCTVDCTPRVCDSPLAVPCGVG